MSFRRKLNRFKLIVVKNAPRISTWGGVGLMIGGTVLACKKTRGLDDILNEYQRKVNQISDGPNCERDIFKEKLKTVGAIAKQYAAPAAMLLGGASAVLLGENAVEKRFAGAMVWGNGLLTALNSYRDRVRSLIGGEDEQKLWSGYKADVVKTKSVNENGEEVETEQKQLVLPKSVKEGTSVYARYFDESCEHYSDSWEYNLMWLKDKQKEMNRLFLKRGYLMLNTVYEALGMQPTQMGCVVGWIYMEDGEHDNYISFGLEKHATLNGLTVGNDPHVLLDFNVDGVIQQYIPSVWH